MKVLFAATLLLTFGAHAWLNEWAPAFTSTPVKVRRLPAKSVSAFVGRAKSAFPGFDTSSSFGGALDLNGDGVEDFVFIVPWLANGLNAWCTDVYFVVSDGKNWRVQNILDGYGATLDDFVKIGGKTFYRHTSFFPDFAKSHHNHWVFQMYDFDKEGYMHHANEKAGKPFPAATVFYRNPKFKPVELTPADLKKIKEETEPTSCRYAP